MRPVSASPLCSDRLIVATRALTLPGAERAVEFSLGAPTPNSLSARPGSPGAPCPLRTNTKDSKRSEVPRVS